MITSDFPLLEIANKTGFESLSYFQEVSKSNTTNTK